jgi:putative aldouronate transport system substrate-binding protein
MKRHLSLVLALVLVVGMLSACGGTATPAETTAATAATTAATTAAATTAAETTAAETTAATTESAAATPVPEEPYTIQVLVGPTNVKNTMDTAVGKVLYDKFKINFEFIPYSGDIREKESLMLAAGDYGELEYMQREDMVINYIKAGALIELDPYLASMPNFTARFKDLIPYWRLSGEGKLFKWETAIPRSLESDIEVNDMMVRSDAIEAAGWKTPRSVDDWVAFLKEAVKTAKDVDGNPVVGVTLPMAEPWGLGGLVPCLYEKGDTYQAASNEAFTYNLKTKLFEDYFKAPPVKDSIKFFNTLYQNGLLDEECFTDTLDKTTEKLNKGKALVGFYVVWCQGGANAAAIAAGKDNMQYISLPIQTNAQVAAGEKREIRMEASRPFDSWGLTTKCKDPARLMKLFDYMSTDEGQILLRSGIEGVHWNYEGGKRVGTDLLKKATLDPVYNETQGIGGWGCGLPWFNLLAADGQPHALTADQTYIDTQGLTQRQQDSYKALGWTSSKSWYLENGFFAPSGLSTAVYIDPTSDIGKTGTKMTELRIKYSTKLIMAASDAKFESIWNEAMAAYEKLSPATYIDEMNRLIGITATKLEEYKNK